MIGLYIINKFLPSEARKGEKKDIKGADEELKFIYRNADRKSVV